MSLNKDLGYCTHVLVFSPTLPPVPHSASAPCHHLPAAFGLHPRLLSPQSFSSGWGLAPTRPHSSSYSISSSSPRARPELLRPLLLSLLLHGWADAGGRMYSELCALCPRLELGWSWACKEKVNSNGSQSTGQAHAAFRSCTVVAGCGGGSSAYVLNGGWGGGGDSFWAQVNTVATRSTAYTHLANPYLNLVN